MMLLTMARPGTISEDELLQGVENVDGVDMHQTNDDDLGSRTFRMLKIDASVPVDSTVFMQQRALRKYLIDGGLFDVVNPDGWQ